MKIKKMDTHNFNVEVVSVICEDPYEDEPFPLTGWEAKGYIYADQALEPIHEFPCEIVPVGELNPDDNILAVEISAEITDLEIGDYYLDIKVEKTENEVLKRKTVFEDVINIRF